MKSVKDHYSWGGGRGPPSPSWFFFAMCFIQFFEVSTFRFWQVTGSNRVPWGLFLAVFTYNLDVKAYSRIFFNFHNFGARQLTETNKHSIPYNLNPKNPMAYVFLSLRNAFSLFMKKIPPKITKKNENLLNNFANIHFSIDFFIWYVFHLIIWSVYFRIFTGNRSK